MKETVDSNKKYCIVLESEGQKKQKEFFKEFSIYKPLFKWLPLSYFSEVFEIYIASIKNIYKRELKGKNKNK